MERSCSVFRPQWSLPLCSGWFWPGSRISETEYLPGTFVNRNKRTRPSKKANVDRAQID